MTGAQWVGKAEAVAADLSWDYFVMYSLASLAATIFVCWCVIIQLNLYQMCPGWGPIRKFDSDGTEEMRINQLLIHEEKQGIGHNLKGDKWKGDENIAFLQGIVQHGLGEAQQQADKIQKELDDAAKGGADEEEGETGNINTNGLYTGFQSTYGSIGACTWGHCESPNQWGEPKYDPQHGEVVVRHGFADTQWMRQHSRTWARDEVYFQQANGMTAPPLTLQDETAVNISHRMVIARGGY